MAPHRCVRVLQGSLRRGVSSTGSRGFPLGEQPHGRHSDQGADRSRAQSSAGKAVLRQDHSLVQRRRTGPNRDGRGGGEVGELPEPQVRRLSGTCRHRYSPCLPPASDYDCEGGSGDGPEHAIRPFDGSDRYLDSDNDGIGVERDPVVSLHVENLLAGPPGAEFASPWRTASPSRMARVRGLSPQPPLHPRAATSAESRHCRQEANL